MASIYANLPNEYYLFANMVCKKITLNWIKINIVHKFWSRNVCTSRHSTTLFPWLTHRERERERERERDTTIGLYLLAFLITNVLFSFFRNIYTKCIVFHLTDLKYIQTSNLECNNKNFRMVKGLRFFRNKQTLPDQLGNYFPLSAASEICQASTKSRLCCYKRIFEFNGGLGIANANGSSSVSSTFQDFILEDKGKENIWYGKNNKLSHSINGENITDSYIEAVTRQIHI